MTSFTPAKNLFDYRDYKDFLRETGGHEHRRTGLKSQMAKAASCDPAYFSRVLQNKVDLSVDQAEALTRFFQFDELQTHYFILLVQLQRAGTPQARKYFDRQLKKTLDQVSVLKERLVTETEITREDQAIYYSDWLHLACHVFTSVPSLRTVDDISKKLIVPVEQVQTSLNFLTELGIIRKERNSYRSVVSSLHLGTDSPFISQHHRNWRMKAMESLSRPNDLDLHYSGVWALSQKDARELRQIMIAFIKKSLAVVGPSTEEVSVCLTTDLFFLT